MYMFGHLLRVLYRNPRLWLRVMEASSSHGEV